MIICFYQKDDPLETIYFCAADRAAARKAIRELMVTGVVTEMWYNDVWLHDGCSFDYDLNAAEGFYSGGTICRDYLGLFS